MLVRKICNELCHKLFTCSCQPKFPSTVVYCSAPSLLRCIVLSFDAFESAYQLKIVLLDATPERNYLVLKTAWPGSVFSENSLTQSVFVFISNINLEGEKNVEKFFSYPSHHTSWSYI